MTTMAATSRRTASSRPCSRRRLDRSAAERSLPASSTGTACRGRVDVTSFPLERDEPHHDKRTRSPAAEQCRPAPTNRAVRHRGPEPGATDLLGHVLESCRRLSRPVMPDRPTARRILLLLRDGGPQPLDQLATRLTAAGRRPIRPATVAAALGELHAAGLATVDDHHWDELTGRWVALPVARDRLLDAVDLHGAHDLRHTYATWLEDAGIPARVIDELMGHQASSRGGQHLGSAMGAHYRHTTPEMAARVVDAIQQRLTVVLEVAELAVERQPNQSTLRVF
jgi:Phage integrase family